VILQDVRSSSSTFRHLKNLAVNCSDDDVFISVSHREMLLEAPIDVNRLRKRS